MRLTALKRLALSVLAIAAVAVLPAYADEWSKTYTVSGKPDLRIETSDANIRVTTWDQNTIEAKVDHLALQDRRGRHPRRRTPDRRFRRNRSSLSPSQLQLRVGTSPRRHHHPDAARGPTSTCALATARSISPDSRARWICTPAMVPRTSTASTASCTPPLATATSRANGRFDELELKTGDGHVDVRATQGSSLAAGWRLETGDGSVSLEVPGDLAADVDLHTSDGHIDLDMPVTTEGKIRQNEVHGKLNGGGNPLTIRTGDGSIHLRKS